MKKKLLNVILPVLLMAGSIMAIVDTDDFSTSAIGTEWSASAAQFRIQSGVMENIHQSGWALAIYKNAMNGSEASITWAATSNSSGVNAAGFALFLDSNDYTTANGYFVFARNGELLLTAITNGQIVRVPELDVQPIATNPTPGSTIKVEYGLNGNTREFKFYVGATLVGTVSTNVVHGVTTDHYAGIVAFGQSGGQYIAKADAFSLRYPSIDITAPAPATNWTEGLAYDITWTASDLTGNVNIDYSSDNAAWDNLFLNVPAANGLQSWTVSKPAQSPSYLRISSVDNPSVQDVTSFSIIGANPFVNLTSPIAGDVWFLNRQHEIKWIYSKIQSIKISYKIEGNQTWNEIVASISTAGGSYLWRVPQSLGETRIKIKVEGIFDVTTYTDESDYFDVKFLATLEAKDAMGEENNSANVAIRLKNMIDLRGLSLKFLIKDPPLKPVTLQGTNDIPIVKKDRVSNFSMTYRYDLAGGDGTLTILLINLAGQYIPAGDDNILEIPLNIAAGATGTTPLTLGNVQLIDKDNVKIDPVQVLPGTFSFVKPGDVDNNNVVDAEDYKILLQFTLGERFDGDSATPTFNDARIAADFDGDGDLDLYDLMKLWDKLNPAP